MKKKTFTKELRENPWMIGTFMLGFFCIALIISNIIETNRKTEDLISPEVLCSKIQVTPSWINQSGEIIGIGFQPVGNQSKPFVNMLIEEKIYFVYHSDCGACNQQIKDFGLEWKRYEKSGLTIDCGSLK